MKSDAENVVKRIEGVEHVDNQIEVLPLSPNDVRIRRATYRAIYGYPSLQKYAMGVQQPIRIIVKNGNVTLEGVVDNDADKNDQHPGPQRVRGVCGGQQSASGKALKAGVGGQTLAGRRLSRRGLTSEVRGLPFSLSKHGHLPGIGRGALAPP